jgi:hypothetical protein
VDCAEIEVEIVSSVLELLVELFYAHCVFWVEIFAFALFMNQRQFALLVNQLRTGLQGFIFKLVDRFEAFLYFPFQLSHFLLFLLRIGF